MAELAEASLSKADIAGAAFPSKLKAASWPCGS